jgi:hypothetical protein
MIWTQVLDRGAFFSQSVDSRAPCQSQLLDWASRRLPPTALISCSQLVTIKDPPQLRARVDVLRTRGEPQRSLQPFPLAGALPIGLCLRLRPACRVDDAQPRVRHSIVERVEHAPEEPPKSVHSGFPAVRCRHQSDVDASLRGADQSLEDAGPGRQAIGAGQDLPMNEEGTHEGLKAHLQGLVNPKIAEHRGRVVKNTGDGFLALASVIDAVRWAVETQRGMADRNAGALIEEVRFATDSPLEGDGFEPSVPPREKPASSVRLSSTAASCSA